MDGSAAPLDEVGRRSSPRMSNCHVGSACRSRCGRDDSGVARRGWGAFTTPEERATSTRRVPGGLAMMVCRLLRISPLNRSEAQKLRSSEGTTGRRHPSRVLRARRVPGRGPLDAVDERGRCALQRGLLPHRARDARAAGRRGQRHGADRPHLERGRLDVHRGAPTARVEME